MSFCNSGDSYTFLQSRSAKLLPLESSKNALGISPRSGFSQYFDVEQEPRANDDTARTATAGKTFPALRNLGLNFKIFALSL